MKTCRGENETALRREFCSSSSSGRRRFGRTSGLVLSCNTKTRKTTGYSQCAFVSRARSRKDAAGILAGASVVILIVTEGGVRFSCFLTCAARICITMFRHGRARVRTNVCKLPSSFSCFAHSFFLSFSSRVSQKKRKSRKLIPRII